VDAVYETRLSTELRLLTNGSKNGLEDGDSTERQASVRTVEHLLAALAGSGVDDARIEIDGSEVPLLDGSAKSWVEAIAEAGVVTGGKGNTSENPANFSPEFTGVLEATSSKVVLHKPIWVYQEDAFVAALPAPVTRFTYGIDFDLPAIGKQWYSWTPEQESFAEAIAPARTFGLAHQIEHLRQAGLIKGGSLENALVCDDTGWLNPPLRFSNEPVRHKLLDLVGDLSLLGNFPVAHFLAYKASHNLHIQLAKELVAID
jgi:UDP-3-O-[3-hydroxymyristoyl] N-acetylglucosamine deacetylase